MKPMLSIRTRSCFTLGLVAFLVTTASAQNSPTGNPIRKHERTARANWQPVRKSNSTDADASYVREESSARRVVGNSRSRSGASPVRQASHVKASHVKASHVQRTGHGTGSPSYPPHSVIQEPIIQEPIIHESYDGGYMNLEPIHDGSMACDAMPGGGCGSISCDGG
ncbi:MAG: hypothetical protein ACF788_09285, partial [Novipirellula sp. JB048]